MSLSLTRRRYTSLPPPPPLSPHCHHPHCHRHPHNNTTTTLLSTPRAAAYTTEHHNPPPLLSISQPNKAGFVWGGPRLKQRGGEVLLLFTAAKGKGCSLGQQPPPVGVRLGQPKQQGLFVSLGYYVTATRACLLSVY
nr:hypothetical protein [Tanacetum cinerariifolium]GFB63780.1 hypothetical protein [Tanacetum cinerariifolium]